MNIILNFTLALEAIGFVAAVAFWIHCKQANQARQRANALRLKAKS
jgi:hypothetical protein